MKFKKGDRVECVKGYYDQFTEGKTYIVRKDGLSERWYLLVEEDDLGKENGHYPKHFKLIEENKMKTSKEVMAEIYRKMADNVERGIDAHSGIQFYCSINKRWIDKDGTDTYGKVLYRIKPETITLRNGVTIPKPTPLQEFNVSGEHESVFIPSPRKRMFDSYAFATLQSEWIDSAPFYKTKEQAIEASKALFGVED